MTSLAPKYHSTRNLNKFFLTPIGVRNPLQFFFYTCCCFGIINTTSTVLKLISPFLLIHSSLKYIGTQIIFITENLINLFLNNILYSILFQTIAVVGIPIQQFYAPLTDFRISPHRIKSHGFLKEKQFFQKHTVEPGSSHTGTGSWLLPITRL